MSGRRALITGGAGFVGSPLTALLARDGVAVTVLDDCRLGSPANWPADVASEIQHAQCDIRDGDAVQDALRAARPDLVYHLAAIHFIPQCDAEPAQALDVNVTGTQTVLDACRTGAPDAAIVFTSSAAVYAPSATAHRETSTIGPTDIYGHTKLWGEHLLALHHARTGAGVGVARLFNVFGPGETNPHLIPAVIAQAEAGDTLQLGNLTTSRDYVFTEDVASAIARIGASAILGGAQTFNVGTEHASSGTEVLEAIGDMVGRKLSSVTDEHRLRKSDRPVLLSNCALAQEVLGWTAETTLAEGLQRARARPLAHGVKLP